MGMILSRFRKRKTTIEILEDLDTKIKEIEQYGHTTEQRHKKIVGTLILYSVILYIITAFIFYFYFFPASLYDQIFYIFPLLIFPILILFTKKMVTGYYKHKLSRNEEKLSTMQSEKKKILDHVTDTETYKKAKEILLKFAPDQLRMTPLTPQPSFNPTPSKETPRRPIIVQNVMSPMSPSGELRRRVVTGQNQPLNVQSGMPANIGLVPVGVAPIQNLLNTPLQSGIRSVMTPVASYRSPLPRPILSRQRTYLDRLIDYLVGDGPSNRCALICRNCESHNGMALKEEFEYFGFRCCYCNFLNPARKQKPSAPKLDYDMPLSPSNINTPHHAAIDTNIERSKLPEGESSNPSDTDSDIEMLEQPIEASEKTEEVAEPVVEPVVEPVAKPVAKPAQTATARTDKPDAAKSETKEMHNHEEGVEKMDIDESTS